MTTAATNVRQAAACPGPVIPPAPQPLASPIAEQLGCALEDGPMGRFIKMDEGKATSMPNVFACRDAARAAGNETLAVADGAMAGFGAHPGLML